MSKARDLADFQGSASALTTGTLPVDRVPYVGRRNILINGDFQVSQRGDFTTATSWADGAYALDRWKNYLNTVTASVQSTDVVINGVNKKALKMTATSSGTGYFGPVQRVELINIPVGEMLTMSAWVRTNNPNVYFRHDYLAGVTGIQSTAPFTADGEWQYATWTLDSTGTVANPVFQFLCYDNGSVSISSGDYIEIADVQLELGSVATPFEHRSYGEELALCQRYYLNFGSANWWLLPINTDNTGGYRRNDLPFPVQMRAKPTMTANFQSDNGTPSNTGFDSADWGSLDWVSIKADGAPAGCWCYVDYITADAEL